MLDVEMHQQFPERFDLHVRHQEIAAGLVVIQSIDDGILHGFRLDVEKLMIHVADVAVIGIWAGHLVQSVV